MVAVHGDVGRYWCWRGRRREGVETGGHGCCEGCFAWVGSVRGGVNWRREIDW